MLYYPNLYFLFLIDVVSCFVVGVAEWNSMYSLGLIFLFPELIETVHVPLLRDPQNGSFETKTFQAKPPSSRPKQKSNVYYVKARPITYFGGQPPTSHHL